MLTKVTPLPPRVPFMNVPAFIAAFREFTVSRDHADALSVERHRDAQSLDVAAELDTHGPGLCIRPGCRRVGCVALKNDILVRHGYEKVPA